MDLQKADNLRCCCREMLSENGQLRQENIKMRNQLLAYSKQFNEIHVAFYKVSKYAQKAYDDYANMWPQDAPMIEILPDFVVPERRYEDVVPNWPPKKAPPRVLSVRTSEHKTNTSSKHCAVLLENIGNSPPPTRMIVLKPSKENALNTPNIEPKQPKPTITSNTEPKQTKPNTSNNEPKKTKSNASNTESKQTKPATLNTEPKQTKSNTSNNEPKKTKSTASNTEPKQMKPATLNTEPKQTNSNTSINEPRKTKPTILNNEPKQTKPAIVNTEPNKTKTSTLDSDPSRPKVIAHKPAPKSKLVRKIVIDVENDSGDSESAELNGNSAKRQKLLENSTGSAKVDIISNGSQLLPQSLVSSKSSQSSQSSQFSQSTQASAKSVTSKSAHSSQASASSATSKSENLSRGTKASSSQSSSNASKSAHSSRATKPPEPVRLPLSSQASSQNARTSTSANNSMVTMRRRPPGSPVFKKSAPINNTLPALENSQTDIKPIVKTEQSRIKIIRQLPKEAVKRQLFVDVERISVPPQFNGMSSPIPRPIIENHSTDTDISSISGDMDLLSPIRSSARRSLRPRTKNVNNNVNALLSDAFSPTRGITVSQAASRSTKKSKVDILGLSPRSANDNQSMAKAIMAAKIKRRQSTK